MQHPKTGVSVQHIIFDSIHLNRKVLVDLYVPPFEAYPTETSLLIINDGQDLAKFHFAGMLSDLYEANDIKPILCADINWSDEGKLEDGTVII